MTLYNKYKVIVIVCLSLYLPLRLSAKHNYCKLNISAFWFLHGLICDKKLREERSVVS